MFFGQRNDLQRLQRPGREGGSQTFRCSKVTVNLLKNDMTVEYNEAVLSAEEIIAAVKKSGYGAAQRGKKAPAPSEAAAPDPISGMAGRLILSFVFLIPLFYISMGHMLGAPLPAFLTGHENSMTFALIQLFLTLPILYAGRMYFKRGFSSLFHGSPNMDSLVAMGSGAPLYTASTPSSGWDTPWGAETSRPPTAMRWSCILNRPA